MGEEFQAGICSDNWWISSRVAVGGLSPCSVGIADFGWPPSDDHFPDIKPKSSSDNSMAFQDHSATFQMMGSSPTSDWNQTDDLLCGGGRGEINFNYSPTNNISSGIGIGNDYCDVNSIKYSSSSSSCQGLFPVDSTTLYGYPSKLQLPSLYDDPHSHPLLNTTSDLSLSSTPNFPSNYDLKPSLPKQPQAHSLSSGLHFTNNTPFWNASAAASTDIIPQAIVSSSLRTGQVLASILEGRNPKCQNSTLALKVINSANSEDGQEPIKKGDHNKNSTAEPPVFKRPRIETPSPLPTFKVRKEKLGDRVTALQQLVSPFGKTDTASVLHEAIEYIKFLHDQVSVLSTPYMKNNNGTPVQHQQVCEKAEGDRAKEDLRSRGLCLVPISSTFPVTNATTPDFWTPTFGGTFR